MRYWNQRNHPKMMTKIRFKFLFPTSEIFIEKLANYDDELDFNEKMIKKLILVFGNHYLLYDSEDENIAYVAMIYEDAINKYNSLKNFIDMDFEKLISDIATAEGENFNPKELQRESLDDSFLEMYQTAKNTSINYLEKYNYIKDNYKKATTFFMEDMKKVLYKNETYVIDKNIWEEI